MTSADGGQTKLALFQGNPQGNRPTAGYHRVALQIDAEGFLAFIDMILKENIGPIRIRDHNQAISIYFDDPHGHHLGVTT